MGLDLAELAEAHPHDLEDFRGRILAVDAYNTLYQFLAIIRQPDGTPLMDGKGRVTSHLTGLIYRNANVLQRGILPVYVFDGAPHPLKQGVLAARTESRNRARVAWEEAREAGDLERARRKAQQSSRLEDPMVESAHELLALLGIPTVEAPADGEAQASYMVAQGDAWATASQDFDALLYGSSRLVRNLTVSGRRKLPGRDRYVDVSIERIELEETLHALEITREQLVDVALLMGTDFNPGIKGIGPKKALALIRKHGDLAHVQEAEGHLIEQAEEVRRIFLEPDFTADYRLAWEEPDPDAILSYLCDGYDFSRDRVQSALAKIQEGVAARNQQSLDEWF